MKQAFHAVQQEFMHLSLILNKLDFEGISLPKAQLMQVNDALSNAYILLNEGFCENVQMCDKCVHNRNQLQILIQMVDECEAKEMMDEETFLALESFTRAIPLVLNKMESLYLDELIEAKV